MSDNVRVTEQLSLSIWLELARPDSRMRHFESLLRLFPFSQRDDQPQTTVSVLAIDETEPPLLEHPMNAPFDVEDAILLMKEHRGDDIAYRVESCWDLWQYDGEWRLAPTGVALACFGSEFDNGTAVTPREQEDLRIDFGVDTTFLPQPEIPGSGRLVESNIKSLLRLVHEVENKLPVRRRWLAAESGENFADRLQRLLSLTMPAQQR
jgi:hypothetical protein